MTRIGIVGATGYTGLELIRTLLRHPEVEIKVLTSETYKGLLISQVFPCLRGMVEARCESFTPEGLSSEVDLAFLCLPHGSSMDAAAQLLKRGLKLIDLSGDFRFKEKEIYERWYGIIHRSPELLGKAVYGLPELFASKIALASFLANPGCYVTGVVLGLAPLLKEGLIEPSPIYADCKSGVTGGGRRLNQRFHYPECNESLMAYSIAAHRHQPEMEECLEHFCGLRPSILFSPHLIPMNRGVLSTIYTRVKNEGKALSKAHQLFSYFYRGKPFVRLLPLGELPNTHNVRGSNFCDIGLAWEERTRTLVVVTALDNLVKGASGQAVQNMNLMLGFPETIGLLVPGDFI